MGLLLLILAGAGCSRCDESSAPIDASTPTAGAEAEDDAAAAEARFLAADPEALVAKRSREPWDLDRIQKRGTLRILLESTGERYLPRADTGARDERALLADFAKRRGLEPEWVFVETFDELFPALEAGEGDVIAAALTVTKSRRERAAFTWAIQSVEEVLIGRRGAQSLPKTRADLAGREVHVRPDSSFAESLEALRAEGVDVKIVPAPEALDPEALVHEVTRGLRPLTVVDSHLLAAIQTYNPDAVALFPIAEGREIAWAVRRDATELRAALNAFIIERVLTEHTEDRFTGDLDAIRKRGELRILTRNNPVTYFLHRGQPFGFDYELMKLAAEQLGVRLSVVVAPSRDELIPWLLEGRGDVIAASFSVTPERARQVAFTRPYLYVDEVLVQRAGTAPIETVAQLSGKAVHVRRSSSYYATLKALWAQGVEVQIVEAPEDQETEELIAQVGEGTIPLTIADSHILAVERAWRDDIAGGGLVLGRPEVVPAAGGAQAKAPEGSREIAFAVRPGNPKLLQWLDAFVKKEYRGLRYNMARNRYFRNERRIAAEREARLKVTGRISEYDDLIRKYATRYGLDWRLLAAQAYQESRFNPDAESWVGAQGLFQVMPATGVELGFGNLRDPEQGTHAGVKYLYRLIRRLDPKIPFKQRVRFALAAYNAGLGHVEDARRIARERGWDPDKWFGHVEKAMLLLERPQVYRRARYGYCRGSEPVKYVSEIQLRYDQYVELVD